MTALPEPTGSPHIGSMTSPSSHSFLKNPRGRGPLIQIIPSCFPEQSRRATEKLQMERHL